MLIFFCKVRKCCTLFCSVNLYNAIDSDTGSTHVQVHVTYQVLLQELRNLYPTESTSESGQIYYQSSIILYAAQLFMHTDM